MQVFKLTDESVVVEPTNNDALGRVVHIGREYIVLIRGKWGKGTSGLIHEDDRPSVIAAFKLYHGENPETWTIEQKQFYDWITAPTLEEAVAEALATVKAVHASMLAKLSGEYTIEERDTWPQQQAWADAYVANKDEEAKGYLLDMLPASIIDDLTTNNVDPAGYLATKIRTKARINKKLMVIAGRVKTEANAAYNAATSLEDVATITAGLEAKQAEAMQEFAAYVEANT